MCTVYLWIYICVRACLCVSVFLLLFELEIEIFQKYYWPVPAACTIHHSWHLHTKITPHTHCISHSPPRRRPASFSHAFYCTPVSAVLSSNSPTNFPLIISFAKSITVAFTVSCSLRTSLYIMLHKSGPRIDFL